MKEFPIGLKHSKEIAVTEENTAGSRQKGAVATFSTPSLLAAMEGCCFEALQPLLEPGQVTVGTAVELKHMAGTPVGMHIRVECELLEQDRRRLTFRVKAFDEEEQVGEAVHERFVVEEGKFMEKALAKQARHRA